MAKKKKYQHKKKSAIENRRKVEREMDEKFIDMATHNLIQGVEEMLHNAAHLLSLRDEINEVEDPLQRIELLESIRDLGGDSL